MNVIKSTVELPYVNSIIEGTLVETSAGATGIVISINDSLGKYVSVLVLIMNNGGQADPPIMMHDISLASLTRLDDSTVISMSNGEFTVNDC